MPVGETCPDLSAEQSRPNHVAAAGEVRGAMTQRRLLLHGCPCPVRGAGVSAARSKVDAWQGPSRRGQTAQARACAPSRAPHITRASCWCPQLDAVLDTTGCRLVTAAPRTPEASFDGARLRIATHLLRTRQAQVWISRLRVTSGFLADLDVRLTQGLNVVVGPRGAGKTTLLEFLRHALGVRSADAARDAERARLVGSLLGSGDIVVDIEDGVETYRLVVDAEGAGRRPEFAELALMLGQNELESIASDASSRLSLIDLRAQVSAHSDDDAAARAMTAELAHVRESIAELEEQLRPRPMIQADYDDLIATEASLLQHATAELTEQREKLRAIEDSVLALQQEGRELEDLQSLLDDARRAGETLLDKMDRLVNGPKPSVLPSIGWDVGELLSSLDPPLSRLRALQPTIERSILAVRERQAALREEAAPIRAAMDEAERGLGEVTTRLRQARSQLARLDGIARSLADLRAQYSTEIFERDALLDRNESRLVERFEARHMVADLVSSQLADSVTISVEHLADYKRFRSFLTNSLQGSGLRYSALVEQIARGLLPRQLLSLLEANDIEGLAAAAAVAEDRAARLAEHLQRPETLAELAVVQLEDRVDFLLQDGATTKSVEELSTGQKCAVTLPILLTEHGRTLLLDQPEDHLDNAYLVENIVVALERRSSANAQTIVATHNANIPVLGSARTVVSLKSDGRRGYVTAAGEFDQPAIVSTITTLMEGGKEAFERRAAFYRSHGPGR